MGRGRMDRQDAGIHLLGESMGKHNRKQSFVQALMDEADELEKELNQPGYNNRRGRRPGTGADFDRHDFGTITEDEE